MDGSGGTGWVSGAEMKQTRLRGQLGCVRPGGGVVVCSGDHGKAEAERLAKEAAEKAEGCNF